MLRYLAIFFTFTAWADNHAYRAAIENWRQQKEVALKADGGWLTVTGLFWLNEGENRVANAPGVFELRGGKTVFRADRGASVTAAGKPVSTIEMDPRTSIDAGSLTLSVIERGGRYGVRVKDKQSKLRKDFRGQQWFPVREQFRIQAKFVTYPKPKPVAILNIIGNHLQLPSPGYAVFKIDGRETRLEPVLEEGDKELFFIFRDQTAGKETYPAGRYLYTDLPRGGKVEIDFNKAENPPCAWTPYATCPLPTPQNRLQLAITAGEQMYRKPK